MIQANFVLCVISSLKEFPIHTYMSLLCKTVFPYEVVLIKNGQIMQHTSVDDIRSREGKSVDAYFREVFKC